MERRRSRDKICSGEIVRGIAKKEGVSLTELAERLGVSRQALYKRLGGDMRFSSFVECMESIGYEVVCRRRETG